MGRKASIYTPDQKEQVMKPWETAYRRHVKSAGTAQISRLSFAEGWDAHIDFLAEQRQAREAGGERRSSAILIGLVGFMFMLLTLPWLIFLPEAISIPRTLVLTLLGVL